MVDHLQTKWFFNRGLDNKVRLGGGGGDNLLLGVAQIPEEYPVDLQGEIFYHLYRELFDLPLFDCLSFSCRSILLRKEDTFSNIVNTRNRQYLGTGISTQLVAPNQFVVHR